MRRNWMTDEERAASHAREKWLRIECWVFGFFQAAIALIVLRALFS